jgi:hypothetical protein
MSKRTHSMKVKSVVVGSMLMGRGLAAPQRNPVWTAQRSYKVEHATEDV